MKTKLLSFLTEKCEARLRAVSGMKTTFTLVAAAMSVAVSAQQSDSLKMERLQEVTVNGVRAQKNAPFATVNINKQKLSTFSTTGQELPFLFARTPGVTAWSENGMGTGTTYMRIRGAGDSRINVTLDGVPLNSPEDQCVFWANMNSYASLLGSVQLQRGVGTSTNGDGAFGGTVAMMSATPLTTPSVEVSGSYGSYNTFNVGGKFSTGLLWDHIIFDGAYHETNTDGFIHGTSGRSGSYYGGLTYMSSDDFVVRYKNFGNFEKTGQAWNGITAGNDDLSLMDGTYGAATGIKTYKDMWDAGLGRYNSLYEALAVDADGNFVKDAAGHYTTTRYQMANGSLWRRATDNFWQNRNILSLAWTADDHWSTSASVYYTYGYGYYNEFRQQNKLSKFGLVVADDQGNNIKRSDFVRKKGMSQNTYGMTANVSYKDDRWDIVGGLLLQQFEATHFGRLTYVSDPTVARKAFYNGRHAYYDSEADKLDGNVFLKAAYSITNHFQAFADVQYRHVDYTIDGVNDKFLSDDNGLYYNQVLDIAKKYDFFNPKAGLSWRYGGHHAYASVAVSHREPERNNFTDNGSYPAPKAEQLTDVEAGYTYTSGRWYVGINGYYMKYTDQFVQTGAVSDIGENLTTNISDSYRMGVELQAAVSPTSWLTLEGNAALSENKIKDFNEVVEDWDNGTQTIHYDNSTLAYSPSMVLNGFVTLHYKGVQAVWHTNFVSRQYLDNTENRDRSLPCYAVSNASLSYTLKGTQLAKGKSPLLKEAIIGLNVNNILNRRYAASGWVYSAICESYGHANDNRYYQIGFIPMAGRTVMGTLTLRF